MCVCVCVGIARRYRLVFMNVSVSNPHLKVENATFLLCDDVMRRVAHDTFDLLMSLVGPVSDVINVYTYI